MSREAAALAGLFVGFAMAIIGWMGVVDVWIEQGGFYRDGFRYAITKTD